MYYIEADFIIIIIIIIIIAFEEDMIDLVHQIRFCKVKSNFQRKLNEDLKTKSSKKKS